MNLFSPFSSKTCFLAVLHSGHKGFSGSQLYWQLFAFTLGSILAMFFARVVLPIPGGPTIITFLSIIKADFSCFLVSSCPSISSNLEFNICHSILHISNNIFKTVSIDLKLNLQRNVYK